MALVTGESAQTVDFEELFRNPTLDKLTNLSWTQFESFIQYVFTCAGYFVEKVSHKHQQHYVDLLLRKTSPRGAVVARVEVRKYNTALIIRGAVLKFLGALQLEGPARGFLVTTSDFTRPAYVAAQASHGKASLINGERLLRYIAYIGGSRENGQFAGGKTSPAEPTSPICILKADELFGQLQLHAHPRILTLANNKGGVAKTTTTLNVGFALASPGFQSQKVLLIDMDGQANLTSSLPAPGVNEDDPVRHDTTTIADYFCGQSSLAQLVRPTRFSNLFIVPGTPLLHHLDSGGYARPDAELQFATDLRTLTVPHPNKSLQPFDWIIIDTPPAQGYFTRSALAAADYIVIPAFAESYAIDGIGTVRKSIQTMRALVGTATSWPKSVLGCVITRWKKEKWQTFPLRILRRNCRMTAFECFAPAYRQMNVLSRHTYKP